MRSRRLRAALLLAPLAAGLLTVPLAPAVAQDGGASGSAVTVAGTGAFEGLQVTVSQTRNLINQNVLITWSGGTPTAPTSGKFGTHYLQVMQCWAENDQQPDRDQCQYGGRIGDGRGGAFAPSRQVSYGSALVDPKETIRQPEGSTDQVFVPFRSVGGGVSNGSRSEFFDASTTNELTFARTRGDGRGTEIFEMQTALEAPGLGCGAAGSTRDCFLVVVPRGDLEVDGSRRSGNGAAPLESSPLSQTNWEQRLVVPLQFEPLGGSCPPVAERPLIGQELAAELVTRWQPALCADGGATYSFSQVTDVFARNELLGDRPGLSLVSGAIDPAEVPDDRPVVYAPVSVSGLTVAFLVERQVRSSASPETRAIAGTAVEQMRLTPRLVAKLLTQSYRNASPDDDPAIADNPNVISLDPEFLALNPEFGQLNFTTLSDALVPAGRADANALLWQWIDADPEARAWLDGEPDDGGMVVHPAYRGIDLPVPDFPKANNYCATYSDDRIPLCAIERRPYAANLNEAGRSASRGDNLARQAWNPLATPPAWQRDVPAPNGQRAVLTVTDTATAARYGLATASLRNAAGEFVKPDAASLTAAVEAMQPGPDPQVLLPDPAAEVAGAYPLTTVTYAGTVPSLLTAEQGVDYGAFLAYAAGPGQEPGVAPGTLPAGYLPLPTELKAVTAAVATQVRTTAGVPVAAPEAPPAPVAVPGPGTSTGGGGGFPSGSTPPRSSPFLTPLAGGDVTSAGLPVGVEVPGPLVAEGPLPPDDTVLTSTGRTAADPATATRYALPIVLLLGLLAGAAGPGWTRLRQLWAP